MLASGTVELTGMVLFLIYVVEMAGPEYEYE